MIVTLNPCETEQQNSAYRFPVYEKDYKIPQEGSFWYNILMKKYELMFSALKVPVDYLMLLCAGFLAYELRYETFLTEVRPVVFEIGLLEYMAIVAVVSLVWLPIFAFAHMYRMQGTKRLVHELSRVILGCSTGLVVIVFAIFFRHELFGSRFIVLFGWLFSIICVFLGRVVIRTIQRSLFAKHIGSMRVVVFGDDPTTYHMIEALKQDPKAGYHVVRHFKTVDNATLGSLSNIGKHNSADLVIHADPNHNRADIAKLAQCAHEQHFDFSYAADMMESSLRTVAVSDLAGVPLVQIKRTPLDGWGRIVKRIADICISFVLIVVLSPLLLLIALLVKVTSKGPVIVRLTRVGENGEQFQLVKFRSMVVGAHAMKQTLQKHNERSGGPLFKMKNDPRITPLGRFIRKWSIDELPNFYNVIKGDMSLVGPRPHEPEEVGQYAHHHKRLLNVKPGVTGLAQISGRSDLDFDEEARLDMYYIENWTFLIDIQILLRTPWVVVLGKHAS